MIYAILMAVGAFAVGSVVFALVFRKVGYNARKRVAEAEIGSAEEEAKRIRADGEKLAERKTCDAFDFENVHIADVPLKKGVNKILFRLTQINDDTKYSLTFSRRISCGIHYTDMAAVDPKFF